MDKKKTLILKQLVVCIFLLATTFSVFAQSVNMVKFCDKKYEYGIGQDSISLYFKIIGNDGKSIRNISEKELNSYLVVKEDGDLIPPSKVQIRPVNVGLRVPAEFTFSVLVDLSIPDSGKEQIFKAIGNLIESTHDGCVYLSFFGDSVSKSRLVKTDNFMNFKKYFHQSSTNKHFYGALYAKLTEFNNANAELEDEIIKEPNYIKNTEIAKRAAKNSDKNFLFIFADGHTSPAFEKNIAFLEVTEYQKGTTHIVPTVFAFYYTEQGQDVDIENVLMGICNPHIEGREGKYMPASDIKQVLANFEEVVNDQMYDYAFTYRATDSKKYFGKTSYEAIWKGDEVGYGDFSIGTAERPWPEHTEDTIDVSLKYLIAFITTILTISFFFIIMKIVIPYCQSKLFEIKFYKKYTPEENISRRICHYCKQEIQNGQNVVTKCKHIMHVHCWKQNDYKCAEFGQNCKIGIQKHIEWSELLTIKSIKDCSQTIAGILAGFFSWIIFELIGRGGFDKVSNYIVKTFYIPKDGLPNLATECIEKTSAFLTIGLLLGFFLSLIFRYNDEYRNKNWKIGIRIFTLSLLTSIIGFVAFAIGASILCYILSLIDMTYIPWYCSLPAYLIFSMSVSLALTIKSSIPTKSAILGGGISSLIGFIVLYMSPISGKMNMLLDFIIYGGGLGASLVTVRVLAEKYFLIIQNGIKAGQRIPIHKWMNATGGGNKVSIGMTGDCEIQMNWEKSNKVAKEHALLYIDQERQLPMIKPLAKGVIYNMRVELPVGKPNILSNGDTIKIGDTNFIYVETE